MYLASKGLSKAYCVDNPLQDPEHGGAFNVISTFFLVILVSDFYEWGWHRLGHVIPHCWNVHKHHHVFFNPSPFAVIADEWADQLVRAFPLLLFPLITPINMDIMFFTYGLFFYAYGVYLHWGYESNLIDAHNGIINTAYHHYAHHVNKKTETV